MEKELPSEIAFEEGDRVDHMLFGQGTVAGVPKLISSLAPFGDSLSWAVPVIWDDTSRQPSSVMSTSLTLVSCPVVRPFAYWNRQWLLLSLTWKAMRRAVEDHVANFRPSPNQEHLKVLRRREEQAWEAMQRFLDDEAAGKH